MSQERIQLEHGAGGLASGDLIRQVFLSRLPHPELHRLHDCALLPAQQGRLALSTDSFVVDPLFFPGGDIGALAVHGTINDLAMGGARPLGLGLACIMEEGLEMEVLERVADSIALASREAGVPVVTGDTKVVPRGKADRLFLTTSGVGALPPGPRPDPGRIRDGDVLLISGPVAEHGITIMTRRAGIALSGDLQSDTRPLHRLVAALLEKLSPDAVRCLRDPTRGGVATALCEMAAAADLAMEVEEEALPLRSPVRAACGILGLDPLYLANEGICIAVVAPEAAAAGLEALRSQEEGGQAAVIGRAREGRAGEVLLRTAVGGARVLLPLRGEALPRIC